MASTSFSHNVNALKILSLSLFLGLLFTQFYFENPLTKSCAGWNEKYLCHREFRKFTVSSPCLWASSHPLTPISVVAVK
jgi:hypothetical protein